MNHLSRHLPGRKAVVPQTVKARPDQVKNDAGGYVFAADNWMRLDRFLIIGTDGSYYVSEKQMTVSASEAVKSCLAEDPIRFINRVVDVSVRRLAPKNMYTLYALALATSHENTAVRKEAFAQLDKVARTGTDLFTFVDFMQGMRGWGRSARTAVSNWYNSKSPSQLSYQMAKYRQRNGWTHHDVLHLAHPKPATPAHDSAFGWAKGNKDLVHNELEFIVHQEKLSAMDNAERSARYIRENQGISWEMVKTEHLSSPDVWQALLPGMPLHALVRNLGRMTANGAIKRWSAEEEYIVGRLEDRDSIIRTGLHPLSTVLAMRTYKKGAGERGNLSWDPNVQILAALEKAVENGFHGTTPTGKRTMYALDVSGSMSWDGLMGGLITPSEVTAILARTLVGTEKKSIVTGFRDTMTELPFRSTMSMSEALEVVKRHTFGRTDCAQPMLYALEKGLDIDAFVVMTDNDTWAGRIHPYRALQQYRSQTGINAKLVVLAMTGGQFTIADPNDPGMLDIAGFSTDVVQVMNSFISL